MTTNVLLPEAWTRPECRYLLRIHGEPAPENRSIVVRPGRPLPLSAEVLGGEFGPTNTISIWEVDPDGNRREVCGRQRPDATRVVIRALGRLLAPADTMDEDDYEELLKGARAARWLRARQTDRRIRRVALDQLPAVAAVQGPDTVLARLLEAFEQEATLDDGSVLTNQLVYLAALIEIGEILGTRSVVPLTELGPGKVASDAAARLRALDERLEAYPSLDAVSVVRVGLAALLHGREFAARRSRTLRVASSDLVKNMRVDTGVMTYGTVPPDMERAVVPLEWLRPEQASLPPGTATVLYSANPAFIRKYAPRLLFYAGLFREYTYHLHLVAERDEAIETARMLDALAEQIAAVRDDEEPVRLRYSTSTVPDWVASPVAYYASARYFVARELLRHSGAPVWIQDVDLFPTGDVSRHEPGLQDAEVSLVVNRLLGGFVPWRRYLAGNVRVRPGEGAERFLAAVEDYLTHWLREPTSWMVDQNALTYAAEQVPGVSMLELGRAKMPTTQSSFPQRIEG